MCAHFREIYSGFTGLYCKSKGILFDFQGPNWLWSVDGHEKVAQPLGGLYIYGAIDTFSRKLMALTVLPNKKAATVVIDINVLLSDRSISRLKCLSTGSYIVAYQKKVMQQQ